MRAWLHEELEKKTAEIMIKKRCYLSFRTISDQFALVFELVGIFIFQVLLISEGRYVVLNGDRYNWAIRNWSKI